MLSLQTGIWTGFTFLRLYRAFGYKETASKYSLEDTESAPVRRGGSLDHKPLREDRYLGRTGDSFREEGQGWRMRYGMTGFLTPQHEVKKDSNWFSVREASRLSENWRGKPVCHSLLLLLLLFMDCL